MDKTKSIPFSRFFLILLCLQALLAFNRDFILSHRYPNYQQWMSDIFPALFGLLAAALINSAIIYGVYRLYKTLTNKKNSAGNQSSAPK